MSKPIKIGLVGLGRAGWGMHCEEIKGKEEQFQIVAACDPLPERLEMMKERYGCKAYNTIEELLADDEVELVDITSRSVDHANHAALALSKGKDVFLEKPIGLNYEQALQLKEAAGQSQATLYIRHNRRFDPDFLHVKEIIASGILGDVYEIKLARHSFQRRDDWQTIKEYGGGQLLNWGPHIIDHALRLMESPVESIWSNLKRVAAVGDAEDHIKIVMTGSNQRIVDLEISGGVAISSPVYLVYGTKGSLSLSHHTITLKYLDPEQTLAQKSADSGTPGATFGQPEQLPWIEKNLPVQPKQQFNIWDELYQSIRCGHPFPITLDEAVEVMKVISEVKKGTPY
jgi:scyllo-inositol 2-dehydrogenase (NADP+)